VSRARQIGRRPQFPEIASALVDANHLIPLVPPPRIERGVITSRLCFPCETDTPLGAVLISRGALSASSKADLVTTNWASGRYWRPPIALGCNESAELKGAGASQVVGRLYASSD